MAAQGSLERWSSVQLVAVALERCGLSLSEYVSDDSNRLAAAKSASLHTFRSPGQMPAHSNPFRAVDIVAERTCAFPKSMFTANTVTDVFSVRSQHNNHKPGYRRTSTLYKKCGQVAVICELCGEGVTV